MVKVAAAMLNLLGQVEACIPVPWPSTEFAVPKVFLE